MAVSATNPSMAPIVLVIRDVLDMNVQEHPEKYNTLLISYLSYFSRSH
jgi:hypothetical protein